MGSEEQIGGAVDPSHLQDVLKKYQEEADKRLKLRPEGLAQYLELETTESERLRAMAGDPWAGEEDEGEAASAAVQDGGRYKVLIVGAGFGGLLVAIQLIEAGFRAERLVDNAGGFGGTWYWNRCPGLHCDVESYCYLPLLEETGYVPRDKYAHGTEILEHVHRLVTQWDLGDKALFRTDVRRVELGEDGGEQLLTAHLSQADGTGGATRELTVQAQYVVLAGGLLIHPKMPRIPGIETFKGQMMHTSRWD